MKRTEPNPTPPDTAGKKHTAPCGRKCILRPDKRHVFCTCNQADCEMCHATERFKFSEPRL